MEGTDQRNDSLGFALSQALPKGSRCTYNYVHTKSKKCEPLFSPAPGYRPEATGLSSHFLGISIPNDSRHDVTLHDDLTLVLGIEVLVYTTKSLTTIFVSKADSTGYRSGGKRLPIRVICTKFLEWLTVQERRRWPSRQIMISLFARAQAQYLFPGSSEHPDKHILDDRQLIKWWARALDPIVESPSGSDGNIVGVAPAKLHGYMRIPGVDSTEMRKYFPPVKAGSDGRLAVWRAGDPLEEIASRKGSSAFLPRALLPRFPDDPKARFMQELDDEVGLSEEVSIKSSPSKRRNGKWKTIHDLTRFWEAMEFRQECSSGRVVGFIWLVVTPNDDADPSGNDDVLDSDEDMIRSHNGSRKRLRKQRASTKAVVIQRNKQKSPGRLKGHIPIRKPKLKPKLTPKDASAALAKSADTGGSLNGALISGHDYDKLMHTLLHLDFGKAEVAKQSTRKWIEEISNILNRRGQTCGITVEGIAESASLKSSDPAASSGQNGINDLGGLARKKRKAPDAVGNEVDSGNGENVPAVNTLSMNLIRKKAPKPPP